MPRMSAKRCVPSVSSPLLARYNVFSVFGRAWAWAKAASAGMMNDANNPEIFCKVSCLFPNEPPLYFRVISLPRNVIVSPGLIS